ncbi:MAG: hypothetical protein ACMV1B_04815 [Prevotella sp.]
MKITLGAKELENIVGSWATDRYEAGIPSVKIVKRRDSIDVIIDYADAKESETLCNDAYNDVYTEDSEETQA